MVIKLRLQTIHPNPGPRTRDKTEEGRRERRERRYAKRQEKRLTKQAKPSGFQNIITWNVQRMPIGTRNSRKLKSVTDYIRKNKYDAALLSEVSSKDAGVTWLGENEDLTAIIYSKKAAILLRGHMLRQWCEEGQAKKVDDRTISVKVGKTILTSTYLPVWLGTNSDIIENEREILKTHASWAKSDETVIIGGDFNAHIGSGEDRPGVCGKFGLRQTNHQGRELLDWMEENRLCYVNSFSNHKRRGTWFNPALRRWYELDGFMMRNHQRHKLVRKICTIGESSLSDHLPKKLTVQITVDKKFNRPRKKPPPRIVWEKLRQDNIASNYKQKVQELLAADNDAGGEEEEAETTEWDKIARVVTEAARETCGIEEKKVENPWMIGRDEEVQQMRVRITAAISLRNQQMIQEREATEETDKQRIREELVQTRQELKDARKDLKRKSSTWEKEWWDNIIRDCRDAADRNDSGVVYKNLRKLGTRGLSKAPTTTTITKEKFKSHFESISKERFENTPEDIENTVNLMEDISNTEKAEEWREILETTPSDEEIRTQMKEMRESAPGEDGVRLIYIQQGGPEILSMVHKMVKFMFENSADKWEPSLKAGLVIPLHKKGDRNVEHNYRGVCLLAMGSRILARIVASRLRVWSEKVGLLDDDQAGFRSKRSTADITQIFYRIQEDTRDMYKRAEKQGIQIPDEKKPAARLLDLRKAYPRVNKPALWQILKKCGMGERALRVIQDLHETTAYKIKSREGVSDEWIPNRGLREGCPSSPPLFNIFHQVVMRLASKARKRKAEELDYEVGICMKWVPGSALPSTGGFEKYNSEAKRIKIARGLFADDTTIAGNKKELDTGVAETKAIMGKFEERNNDDKEEVLEFGTEESNEIRMLGVWLGEEEDVKQRLKRAGHSWMKIKNQLKGSRLSKKMQAKIVESCVESTLLFDCSVRTWQKREIKKLQQCMDRKYRQIWSRGTGPPLVQMQQEHKNMYDVRRELGIKSVQYKIEKRVLERIGHVLRMEDDRTVKAATLGWLEELESLEKLPGRKRKTMLYWKQLLREAKLDVSNMGQLTADKDEWRAKVRERMHHIDQWEQRGGHGVEGERGPRTSPTPEQDTDFMCDVEGCGKVCISKAGLTNHKRRMHEISKAKVIFKCADCDTEFRQEANLKNHQKSCSGVRASDPSMKKCNNCQREVRRENFSRHRRVCGGGQDQPPAAAARVYVAKQYLCEGCNLYRSSTNRAKHQRKCLGGP